MKKDYWLERWEREEIGFHRNEFNPYLRQYWHELHPVPEQSGTDHGFLLDFTGVPC